MMYDVVMNKSLHTERGTVHKKSYIYSKGKVRIACSCGWNSSKLEDTKAGHAMLDLLDRTHKKEKKS